MKKLPVLIILSILLVSCKNPEDKKQTSLKNYNLLNGEKLTLPGALREISGICFFPGSDSLLMAVNDEEGKLFSIPVYEMKDKMETLDFAPPGDYEDLAFFGGNWIVLESNGKLWKVEMGSEGIKSSLLYSLPKSEYEGLAATQDTLFAVCKYCKKNKEEGTTIYKLVQDSAGLALAGINTIKAAENKIQSPYSVSALGLHPIEREWYILSHNQSLLLITDRNFNILESISLPKRLFEQPEGIAFNTRGDMFISSEGNKGKGYILKFSYKK